MTRSSSGLYDSGDIGSQVPGLVLPSFRWDVNENNENGKNYPTLIRRFGYDSFGVVSGNPES